MKSVIHSTQTLRSDNTVPRDVGRSDPENKAKKTNPVHTAKSVVSPASIKSALLSSGLGNDNLNKALFIFTRFFSLSPGTAANPGAMLSLLRREVLSSLPAEGKEQSSTLTDESDVDGRAEKAEIKLENRALAAAVLSDKGVKLSSEALEAYVKSQVPDIEINPDGSREQPHGDRHHDILNKIPGKNGQRWVVWPFSANFDGTKLNVLVRLLLKEPISSMEGRLFVDISGKTNSWSFILDRLDGSFNANIKVFPEKTPFALKKLQKEAIKFLSPLGITEIVLENGKKHNSLAQFLEKETFVSVEGEA